jgi:hypothetical protein
VRGALDRFVYSADGAPRPQLLVEQQCTPHILPLQCAARSAPLAQERPARVGAHLQQHLQPGERGLSESPKVGRNQEEEQIIFRTGVFELRAGRRQG